MQINFGTQTIDFSVKYTNRKSIEIGVEAPEVVRVVAPQGIKEKVLIDHIKSKGKWIIQKLYEIRCIQAEHFFKEYINGESFMYLGRNYSLKVVLNKGIKKAKTKLHQGKFIIDSPSSNQEILKKSMEEWFRNKTDEKVTEKVKYFQKYIKEKPTNIKVKEQKKRWASCTSKRELLFNWRCVMAPSFVLDYIVVHEMCHLVHMDHSKEFWSLVGKIIPDYESRRDWLKCYGVKMDL